MFNHLRPAGHTVPNAGIYPWQWLWDSAFHAVAWNALGHPDRAVRELTTSLEPLAADGFVPHVRYHGSNPHAAFWNRSETSSITQPPMFGHAIAELVRANVSVPDELVERAVSALGFLLHDRSRVDGLVTVVHPWETGADNSPRWDYWCRGGFTVPRWYQVKGHLVGGIVMSPRGSPISNDRFVAAPAGFNALIAFNALELAAVADNAGLAATAFELIDAIDAQWDPDRVTWTDAGDAHASSGRVRTLDGLLPLLVSPNEHAVSTALGAVIADGSFGAPYGPLGVHRAEPSFEPGSYWRGGTWPQLAYLIWLGARRAGHNDIADMIAERTTMGALRSGFAEYWDGDTGEPSGAVPQSWTTLVAAMDRARN